MTDALLLTGATGFVGRSVLARLLERTERDVVVLVRAEDDAHAARRIEGVLEGLVDPELAARGSVHALAADLSDLDAPSLVARIDALDLEVREVVHSAACVTFDLPIEEARSANVAATANLLAVSQLLHERTPLRRHAHVSTAYVAGTRAGWISEDDGDHGQSFRNTYEQSKLEAEELVRATDGLPLQILRPSIVVGEAATGWTSAFNVLYVPLRALASGGLAAVPQHPGGHVDVVPVDYVADAVLALADAPASGQAYHLAAGDRAIPLERLVELTCRVTGQVPPPVVAPEAFGEHIGDSAVARVLLAHLDDYLPYMVALSRFDCSRARDHLEPRGITAPPLEDYLAEVLSFATSSRWGRTPVSRIDARHERALAA